MIRFEFNDQLQILEVFYEGTINFIDLVDYGNKIFSNSSLPRDLKILTYASGAGYHLEHHELPLLTKKLEEHIRPYNKIRAAFIQSRPRETAYSILMEQEIAHDKYDHAVFSTRKAALEWLLVE
ncbi:MAG: hypothetical protein ACLFQA_11735 [Bacteroidales bacterium]